MCIFCSSYNITFSGFIYQYMQEDDTQYTLAHDIHYRADVYVCSENVFPRVINDFILLKGVFIFNI